ncbi:AfsR/SARP family transcriptional regulator [Streptomyces tropicalis]|uniref:BTAD domain-containing putative transcriptional regulator n=1 Tax=Streptomyces tropicalis TaxID=3034234 RepID=A0ABT6A7L2_9ACTN|nr:BTAD domain-containing putative transcriptional regulator [Streptomyces tropicalis]MDF3300643.1 BTAD domain-containing putative transcriptional regulator [Streptomyces tropicalis]
MRCELRFGLLGPPVLYRAAGTEGERPPGAGAGRTSGAEAGRTSTGAGRASSAEADRTPCAEAGCPLPPVRPIGSPKVRALLAALLLEAGRVVPVETLKDALWGGAPPVSAQASLHNHVARLRRLLDDPDRLRAVPTGYVLRVDRGELDLHVFEDRLTEARAAHSDGAWARVLRACTAALALWRGEPLSGLPAELGGYAVVQRLDEARLLLLEWRYDAELALGGPRLGGLVPELAALAAEYPLREAYHRQLMLALHRTGRRAEALAVHRDLRARLVGELGVEPGPAVREAHLEVLRGPAAEGGEPAVHGQSPAPEDDMTAQPSPAQLPPPPAHFTGRGEEVRALRRTLAGPPGKSTPVAVVSGMAGVGKSALALHAAHGLRERFPDGQLYVHLHGATPGMTPLTPGAALRALLRDLGAEPRRIPEHPDAAAALLRTLLAPTRTLLVLDDAESAAQVRPLLPAGAGCAVIVTSRSPLTALDGARRFPLAPLSGEDSAALLRAVSGRDGLDAGHPLVELTGRLPLALRVVAARLAARRALAPDVLAGQLTATGGRLRHLEYDDLSVRRSLAVAHDALGASDREADRDAAHALNRIGALDLPVYGAALLARLTGTDEPRAEAALDRLVDVALLEESAYGRYVPHDLVRDFARELAETAPGADAAEAALRWYAAVAEHALAAIVEPGLDREDRLRPTVAQPPEHTADVRSVAPFAGAEEAFAWGDVELENVVALAGRCGAAPSAREDGGTAAGDRRTAHLSTLIRLFFPYAQRSGRVAEMEVLGGAGLEAARALGDEGAEAYALGDLAGLHFLTGRQNEALALNDRSLEIWRRLGVPSRIRRCLNNRGLLLQSLGRHDESGDALRQSLECSRQLNDPYGEAVTHSHLGNLYEHTDPRAAIGQHRRSLAIGHEIGAVIVQHTAHCNIGYAHLTLGEPEAAAGHFEESLGILGAHGDWHGESQTRLGLVRALRELGRPDRAHHECGVLLHRADTRADRYTGGLARHQLGLVLRDRGDLDEARTQWRAALVALDGTDERAVAGELRELLEAGSGTG